MKNFTIFIISLISSISFAANSDGSGTDPEPEPELIYQMCITLIEANSDGSGTQEANSDGSGTNPQELLVECIMPFQ